MKLIYLVIVIGGSSRSQHVYVRKTKNLILKVKIILTFKSKQNVLQNCLIL